jgi:hypothetical protein
MPARPQRSVPFFILRTAGSAFVIFGIDRVNRLDIACRPALGIKGIGQKRIGNIFG